jgi:festuclavine dehydrogenase
MTILLTGGTGKTGSRLARLLKDAGQSFLIATRSPENLPEAYRGQGVKFDWYDPATHENPFKADANIDRVYLVGVDAMDMLTPMRPWIDLAVSKGVKRIVVLSATVLLPGGLAAGAIHKYVAELGIDYCVLRPTWFIGEHSIIEKSRRLS